MIDPTGLEHAANDEDIFFSTTDRKGIILEANEVFTRIARHPFEELCGAPHNIIRHPSMPGGAFKLMWDTLLDDAEPFCAYVRNMAGDGSAYWAFATITPVAPDLLLSVRCRPMRIDLRDAADGIYARVRPLELDAVRRGASHDDAAVFGLGLLAAELANAGFPTYETFESVVLPAEMAARRAVIPAGVVPPRGLHAFLRMVVGVSNEVSEHLRELAVQLALAQENGRFIGDHLSRATSDLALVQNALRVSGPGPHASLISRASGGVLQQADELADLLAQVVDASEASVVEESELAFRVALTELQAELVGRFALAVGAGREDIHRAQSALTGLSQALSMQLSLVDAALASGDAADQSYGRAVKSASRGLALTSRLLASWKALAGSLGAGPTGALDDAMVRIDADVAAISQDAQRRDQAHVDFHHRYIESMLGRLDFIVPHLG